eukprot:TRINITY_DN4482_c0_g1_i1.p1 TRINITY_DN4482_c0_g1~~TRINITY_DN4482_c0_g1_i1.p1  ORF type:complete len:1349 (+),score=284.19 TRINITY_DN4482_c0_g1_i1:513-4559(+)
MSFTGCTFYIHPLTPDTKTLQKCITQFKGEITDTRKRITHLIAPNYVLSDPNQFDVILAKKYKVTLVDPEWIYHYARDEAIAPEVLRPNKFKRKYGNQVIQKNAVASVPAGDIPDLYTSNGETAPTVTLLVPSCGHAGGGYQVALFGLNFVASSYFKIKFGDVECVNYHFHGSTSVIATLPEIESPVYGNVVVCASNDGKDYGYPSSFSFIGENEKKKEIEMNSFSNDLFQKKVKGLKNAIQNIIRMENDIIDQVKTLDSYQNLKTNTNNIQVKSSIVEGNDSNIKEVTRELKVFICAPFADTIKERGEFIKYVLPSLQRTCLEKDIIFSYMFFKWDGANANALLRNLYEIESCDIFIGILGERYGWHVSDERDTGNDDLIKQNIENAIREFSWVENYRGSSVTDIQMRMILEGHYFRDKESMFFMRDRYYVEEVEEKEQYKYFSEGPRSYEKLVKLKKLIQESPVEFYTYDRPGAVMNEIIREKLYFYAESHYENKEISSQEKENLKHTMFREQLVDIYYELDKFNLEIGKYINSTEEKPYVICGPPGSGKSAMVANWTKKYQTNNNDILIYHFIGASSKSLEPENIILRIMTQAEKSLNVSIGFDENNMLRSFPKWIEAVSEKIKDVKLVIFIDGFDRIASKYIRDLLWFPHTYPKQLRFILTTRLNDYTFDIFSKREYPQLELPPLAPLISKKLIGDLSIYYSVNLSTSEIDRIMLSRLSPNPRFLKILINELSLVDSPNETNNKLEQMLGCQNISDLYLMVLNNFETMYNKGCVMTLSSFIACTDGLSFEEISELMRIEGIEKESWENYLNLSIKVLFSSTSDRVSLQSNEVRDAIERRYLSTKDMKYLFHTKLSNYYNMIEGTTQRKIEELPIHLLKSNQYDELASFLSDLQVFDLMYTENNKYVMFFYWREIESNTRRTSEIEFRRHFSRSSTPTGVIISDVFSRIGKFFYETNKFKSSEAFYLKAVEYYSKSSQIIEAAKTKIELSLVYSASKRTTEAEKALQEAYNSYMDYYGKGEAELCVVLNNLGILYLNQGKLEEASRSLNEALNICEEAYDEETLILADICYSLGCVELSSQEHEASEKLLLKSLRIKEKLLGYWDPEVSHILNRLGTIYLAQDQFNDALICYERALEIRTKKLGPDHSRVAQTLKHLITLNEAMEDYHTALKHGLKALAIMKRIYGDSHFHVSSIYLRLASIYWMTGEKSIAKENTAKCIEIREALYPKGDKSIEDAMDLMREITSNIQSQVIEVSVRPTQQTTVQFVDHSTIPVPPPPPPQLRSIKVGDKEIRPRSGALLNDIKNYTRDSNLKHNYAFEDYKPDKMAKKMLALRKRKLFMKKLW